MFQLPSGFAIMRGASARGWGIEEVELGQIALALVSLKNLYALWYISLNAAQHLQLE